MSDRSGVGAPTHDGADPDPEGQGTSTDTVDEGGLASAVRSRLGRDLFGAALGAEPATDATPPGVPDVGASAARASGAAAVDTVAPEQDRDTESVGRTLRRRLTTRREITPDGDGVVDAGELDEVIDSSVDPGVVPVLEAPRRSNRKGALRARKVHRIVRRVDPWSVLKLCLVFYFCVWLMIVVSGVLIWGVAVGSGTVDSVEDFIEGLMAFEEFHFNADQIFRLFAMGGLILVFLATAMSAVLAVLFNLISDLIGGIRVTVIEEESTRRVVASD